MIGVSINMKNYVRNEYVQQSWHTHAHNANALKNINIKKKRKQPHYDNDGLAPDFEHNAFILQNFY